MSSFCEKIQRNETSYFFFFLYLQNVAYCWASDKPAFLLFVDEIFMVINIFVANLFVFLNQHSFINIFCKVK